MIYLNRDQLGRAVGAPVRWGSIPRLCPALVGRQRDPVGLFAAYGSPCGVTPGHSALVTFGNAELIRGFTQRDPLARDAVERAIAHMVGSVVPR